MATALVIEDSLTEREIITQYLKLAGMTAHIASSGEEGLEKLKTDLPDLIVLDVVLPGLSGFEICRTIKAEERTHEIPVIICSTKDTDMDKFWGKRQGANAYIPKPIDQDTFLNTIKQLVP
ncbi:MAG: response regulator transcription factor [Crocosphaera sp.]